MRKLIVIKRVLCSFLAAAMIASLAGCNKEGKTEKSAFSVNSPRQITNYFKSADFEYPDEIAEISNILCVNDKTYLAALPSGSNADHYITVYDTATGKNADVDVSAVNIGYLALSLLTQDIVYIEYVEAGDENFTYHICALDRKTGALISDIALEKDSVANGLFENADGDICTVFMKATTNIPESVMIIYDKKTLEVKEEVNLSEKFELPKNEIMMLTLPQKDGTYYQVSVTINFLNGNQKINIYKMSSSFELIYSVKDVASDMEGDLNTAFVKENGNPCVVTSDMQTGVYNINELDALTGEVVDRYEPKLSNIQIVSFYASKDCDFVFKRDSGLFGYDMENDKETEIVDISKKFGEDYVENCAVSMHGSDILFIAENFGGGSIEMLYEMDSDGNLINKVSLPKGALSSTMKVSKDGLIGVVCEDIVDGRSVYEICFIDTQGEKKSVIPVSAETGGTAYSYVSDFTVSDSGDVCIAIEFSESENSSVKTNIFVYDKDGNEKFRIEDEDISYVNRMFSKESGDYVFYYSKKSGTQLCKIDYEKKCLGEKLKTDVSFDSIYPGDAKYDFYYNDNEGIYGYSIKDNKAAEIINWVDSDIDSRITNMCIVNDNRIIASGYDNKEGKQYVLQLDRVDDETLKSIQNKKMITAVGVNVSDTVKTNMIKFNKANDKYRVQLTDYGKYDTYEDETFFSGANRLNADLVSGELPDVLIGGYELDMSSYESKGLLADLNPFIEKDADISKENYFENIFDIYSKDGKLYQLVTDFSIQTFAGREADFGDKSGWTFDEFFEFADGKDVFYETGRDKLLKSFVLNNLSEYVDFDKKSCDFNNDNFIKLLEYIKENGLTEEQLDEIEKKYSSNAMERYKHIKNRYKDKKCLLDIMTIYSTDILGGYQQFELDDAVSFKGIPSSSGGNGALISSDATIGISEKSDVKDGAWDFVRGFMLEDYQKELNDEYSTTLPVLRSAFEDMVKKSQSKEPEPNILYLDEGTPNKLDDKAAERFRNLVETTTRAAVSDSRISKIIEEQADTFFEGGQSAKEAAEAIQSKTSLYLKEIK